MNNNIRRNKWERTSKAMALATLILVNSMMWGCRKGTMSGARLQESLDRSEKLNDKLTTAIPPHGTERDIFLFHGDLFHNLVKNTRNLYKKILTVEIPTENTQNVQQVTQATVDSLALPSSIESLIEAFKKNNESMGLCLTKMRENAGPIIDAVEDIINGITHTSIFREIQDQQIKPLDLPGESYSIAIIRVAAKHSYQAFKNIEDNLDRIITLRKKSALYQLLEESTRKEIPAEPTSLNYTQESIESSIKDLKKPRGGGAGGDEASGNRFPRQRGGNGGGEEPSGNRSPDQLGGNGSGEEQSGNRFPDQLDGNGGGEEPSGNRSPRQRGGNGGGEEPSGNRPPSQLDGNGGGEEPSTSRSRPSTHSDLLTNRCKKELESALTLCDQLCAEVNTAGSTAYEAYEASSNASKDLLKRVDKSLIQIRSWEKSAQGHIDSAQKDCDDLKRIGGNGIEVLIDTYESAIKAANKALEEIGSAKNEAEEMHSAAQSQQKQKRLSAALAKIPRVDPPILESLTDIVERAKEKIKEARNYINPDNQIL